MRAPLDDGWNSVAHIGLGYLFGAKFAVPFLIYQLAQGRPNDLIDCFEYLSGWLLNSVVPVQQWNRDAGSSGTLRLPPDDVDGSGQ